MRERWCCWSVPSDKQVVLVQNKGLAPSSARGIRTHTRPRLFPTLFLPVQPAASVLSYVLVANLACQLRRGTTPHARLAVEDHFLVRLWFGKAETVFKLVGWKKHGVWL